MKEFITKNFTSIIIIILVSVLYFQKCSEPKPIVPPPQIIETIIHHYHDSTITTKPTIIKQILPTKEIIPPQMVPDTNYARLKVQYEDLVTKYLTKNISIDSLKVDSLGTVEVKDTIGENKILGREWKYHFDIPEKKITIIQQAKPKNQLYIGGGILGNEIKPLNGVETNILLKNKRDQLYGIGAQKIFNQPVNYKISGYFKLKFHK